MGTHGESRVEHGGMERPASLEQLRRGLDAVAGIIAAIRAGQWAANNAGHGSRPVRSAM